MSAKGNRYLVADVCTLVLQSPDAPLWIVYDQTRRRFVVESTSRAGRKRTQIGPYAITTSLWQLAQDVDAAVTDLRRMLSLRA